MRSRRDDRATDGAVALVLFACAAVDLFVPPVDIVSRIAGLVFAVGAGVWLSLATRP